MKKIIIVIILSLITNISYAATEKVYLKCEKIVTINKSTTLVDRYAEGNFSQIALAEILISKKNTKISVYEPFPGFEKYKESFNIKLDVVVPKRKAKITDNSYTVEDGFSGTDDGKKLDIINRYIFTKNDNNWLLKGRVLLRAEGGVDISYITEGKCILVNKKYYKNLLKNGPTQEDYNF